MPRGKRGPTAATLYRKLTRALEALRAGADEEGWMGETSGVVLIKRALRVHLTEAQQLHVALGKIGLRGREGGRSWVAIGGEVTMEDAEAVYRGRPTAHEWASGRHSRSEGALRELIRQWLIASVHPGDVWRYTSSDLEFDVEVLELRRRDISDQMLHTPSDYELPLPDVWLVLPVPYVPALARAGSPTIRVMDSIPGALFYARASLGELMLVRSGRSE